MLAIVYLVTINATTFVLFGYDKRMALKHKIRTSEYGLIQLMALGGVFGAIVAMKIFNHKVRKTKFKVITSLILFAYIYLIFLLLLNN